MKVDTGSLKSSIEFREKLEAEVFNKLKVKKSYLENGKIVTPVREHLKSNKIKLFGTLDGATKPLTDKIKKGD